VRPNKAIRSSLRWLRIFPGHFILLVAAVRVDVTIGHA
jgi:hypothetical protein